jgi:hypothetical protein
MTALLKLETAHSTRRPCQNCASEMIFVREIPCVLPDRVRRLFACGACGVAVELTATPFGTDVLPDTNAHFSN